LILIYETLKNPCKNGHKEFLMIKEFLSNFNKSNFHHWFNLYDYKQESGLVTEICQSISSWIHFLYHGQLYVALSRVTSKKELKILIADDEDSNTTENVVYKEDFHNV
jgi:hypothetical protein